MCFNKTFQAFSSTSTVVTSFSYYCSVSNWNKFKTIFLTSSGIKSLYILIAGMWHYELYPRIVTTWSRHTHLYKFLLGNTGLEEVTDPVRDYTGERDHKSLAIITICFQISEINLIDVIGSFCYVKEGFMLYEVLTVLTLQTFKNQICEFECLNSKTR